MYTTISRQSDLPHFCVIKWLIFRIYTRGLESSVWLTNYGDEILCAWVKMFTWWAEIHLWGESYFIWTLGSKSRNLCRIRDFQVWRNYFAGVKFLGQEFLVLDWDVRGNNFSKKRKFWVLVNLFFMIILILLIFSRSYVKIWRWATFVRLEILYNSVCLFVTLTLWCGYIVCSWSSPGLGIIVNSFLIFNV